MVPYEHPSLEPILSDTLGAIVFQDQVIQVAMALAGFSAGEAEGLRRAMSRKRSEAAHARLPRPLHRGRGRPRASTLEVAERVFDQIKGFSGFGFPKSHAAAFGLLAYQSTWLRVHYGPEFLCALLNEQPMGFYPPDALVHEAQRRGIEVLGPDVNRSRVECAVDGDGGGPGGPDRARLHQGAEGARRGGGRRRARARRAPTRDLGDLASRSGASRDGARAARLGRRLRGARTGDARRRGIGGAAPLWRLGVARGRGRTGSGRRAARAAARASRAAPALAEQTPWERVMADYGSQGMSLDEHPLELLRPGLDPATVTCADLERIPDGTELVVAGMLVARQRPATAKGVMFLLIEDETGVDNVIVLPPVYDRHRLTVRTASLVSVSGKLERREGVINVLASARPPAGAPGPAAGGGQAASSRRPSGRPGTARWPTSMPSCRPSIPSAAQGPLMLEAESLVCNSLHEHVYVRGRSYLRPR